MGNAGYWSRFDLKCYGGRTMNKCITAILFLGFCPLFASQKDASKLTSQPENNRHGLLEQIESAQKILDDYRQSHAADLQVFDENFLAPPARWTEKPRADLALRIRHFHSRQVKLACQKANRPTQTDIHLRDSIDIPLVNTWPLKQLIQKLEKEKAVLWHVIDSLLKAKVVEIQKALDELVAQHGAQFSQGRPPLLSSIVSSSLVAFRQSIMQELTEANTTQNAYFEEAQVFLETVFAQYRLAELRLQQKYNKLVESCRHYSDANQALRQQIEVLTQQVEALKNQLEWRGSRVSDQQPPLSHSLSWDCLSPPPPLL